MSFFLVFRRRKGLNEEVSVLKYFDDVNVIEALKQDESYRTVV